MTELVMTTDGERALTPGRFYWARVRRPLTAEADTFWQPVRFTGMAGDSVGLTWDFVGINSDVGHHHADVVEIGREMDPEIAW